MQFLSESVAVVKVSFKRELFFASFEQRSTVVTIVVACMGGPVVFVV